MAVARTNSQADFAKLLRDFAQKIDAGQIEVDHMTVNPFVKTWNGQPLVAMDFVYRVMEGDDWQPSF